MLMLAVQTRQGWTTIGALFSNVLAVYVRYRLIRKDTELLGAKVLNEDGSVNHVIF